MSIEKVKDLQRLLVSKGYNLVIDGKYGPQTKKAEEDYNNKLKVTSKQETKQKKETSVVKTKISAEIIKFANSCVGQEEVRGNLGFKTPWFHKLMVGVGFQRTHPWCAYFSELCWREGYKNAMPERKEIDTILHNLFSASVMQTRNNFVKNGSQYGFIFSQTPKPGSLILWQSATNRSVGHIGVVERVSGMNIHTI
jgi:hypothetical protein